MNKETKIGQEFNPTIEMAKKETINGIFRQCDRLLQMERKEETDQDLRDAQNGCYHHYSYGRSWNIGNDGRMNIFRKRAPKIIYENGKAAVDVFDIFDINSKNVCTISIKMLASNKKERIYYDYVLSQKASFLLLFCDIKANPSERNLSFIDKENLIRILSQGKIVGHLVNHDKFLCLKKFSQTTYFEDEDSPLNNIVFPNEHHAQALLTSLRGLKLKDLKTDLLPVNF